MGRRHPPLTASSVLTLAVGRWRPPVVALSSSTLAASATVVAVVGRRGPLLVTSSSSTPAASATVVGRRRLPFVASSSLTVRGLLPRSTARNLRLAHPDDPS